MRKRLAVVLVAVVATIGVVALVQATRDDGPPPPPTTVPTTTPTTFPVPYDPNTGIIGTVPPEDPNAGPGILSSGGT